MNEHASALGKLAKGHKKTITAEERQARAVRMEFARRRRWAKLEAKIEQTRAPQ